MSLLTMPHPHRRHRKAQVDRSALTPDPAAVQAVKRAEAAQQRARILVNESRVVSERVAERRASNGFADLLDDIMTRLAR